MAGLKLSTQDIKLIENTPEYLNITFTFSWYQEDIYDLIKLIFKPIMPLNIQESILGADRENIRFKWHQYYFVVNFECYSQSCWIEGQDEQSKAYLLTLYAILRTS
jgi:hypothetical protein